MSMRECTCLTFFERDDLHGRGIGFVFFFRSHGPEPGSLLATVIDCASVPHTIRPTQDARPVDDAEVTRSLRTILSGDEPDPQRRLMKQLLVGEQTNGPGIGLIETHGFLAAAEGWLCVGWTSRNWTDDASPGRFSIAHERGQFEANGTAVLFPRYDLQGRGTGVLVFVQGKGRAEETPLSVTFETGGIETALLVVPGTVRWPESKLLDQMRLILTGLPPKKISDALRMICAGR
jgi:hypothetical protein